MLRGKGFFIWQVDRADGGAADALVGLARQAGLTHVIVKIADGKDDFPLPAQDPGGRAEALTDAAIRAFQAAGIEVWGLTHTQGRDPVMEAHRAASRVLKWNLKGLVVGPQSQYLGQHNRARQFMATLRVDLGNDPNRLLIAFSLFLNPDVQDSPALPLSSRFPIDEFVAQCDVIMPQVYWIARDGGDPAGALRENYDQYRRRYPDKPYVPTGAAFGERYGTLSWSATPAQIELFLNQARALGLPAVNFWSWQHARGDTRNPLYTGTQLWDAAARYPWPVEDTAEPVDPFADGVEIVPPGDARYLDGVYSTAGDVRFSVMQSPQGPVRYTPTHSTRSQVWAQWTPGIRRSARYEIAVFVPGTHATTRRARYHIRGVAGQSSTVVVELDQNRYYDRFVPLGVFDLDAARPDSGAVNLNNLTGETGREIAFSPIRWRLVEQPDVPLADGYDAPVGTPAERAADKLWPGAWMDANPFGARYQDGANSTAYHTGADLNLNAPRWDSDRGAPVYAIASGTVVYAGQQRIWGNLVVIRHDPMQRDGNPVWARYAHLDQVQVQVGQRVARGQQIAVVGKPEPAGAPYHLHFDICTSGVIEQNPTHWPRLDYQALVDNYTDPRAFLLAHRPAGGSR